MLIVLRIRRKRPSLRLIVSSATLDATSFLNYFASGNSPGEATIVSLEGRGYPVQVAYLQDPVPDYVQKAVDVIWSIHLQVSPILHTSPYLLNGHSRQSATSWSF